jgi:hypothetical protein
MILCIGSHFFMYMQFAKLGIITDSLTNQQRICPSRLSIVDKLSVCHFKTKSNDPKIE